MSRFGSSRHSVYVPQTKSDVWSPSTIPGGGFSLDLRSARVHSARELINELDQLAGRLANDDWLTESVPSFAAVYSKRPVRLDDCRWVIASACNWSFPEQRDDKGNLLQPAVDMPRAPQLGDKELVELMLRFPGVRTLFLKNQVSFTETGLIAAIRNLADLARVVIGPHNGPGFSKEHVLSAGFHRHMNAQRRSNNQIVFGFADHAL